MRALYLGRLVHISSSPMFVLNCFEVKTSWLLPNKNDRVIQVIHTRIHTRARARARAHAQSILKKDNSEK